jgi:hypothetical protein
MKLAKRDIFWIFPDWNIKKRGGPKRKIYFDLTKFSHNFILSGKISIMESTFGYLFLPAI